MMLGRIPFLKLQDDDEVLTNILQNHYEVDEASSFSASSSTNPERMLLPVLLEFPATTLLATTMPADELPIDILPTAIVLAKKLPTITGMFHTMFPYELKVPCINDAAMIELTTQIQVSEGRYLNINYKLSNAQQFQLTNLLISHQHAFGWDYHYMKGLDPKICTHWIFIRDGCQPVRYPQC